MIRNRVACPEILRVPVKEYDQFIGSPMDAWQIKTWDVVYNTLLIERLWGHDHCLSEKLVRCCYIVAPNQRSITPVVLLNSPGWGRNFDKTSWRWRICYRYCIINCNFSVVDSTPLIISWDLTQNTAFIFLKDRWWRLGWNFSLFNSLVLSLVDLTFIGKKIAYIWQSLCFLLWWLNCAVILWVTFFFTISGHEEKFTDKAFLGVRGGTRRRIDQTTKSHIL